MALKIHRFAIWSSHLCSHNYPNLQLTANLRLGEQGFELYGKQSSGVSSGNVSVAEHDVASVFDHLCPFPL